MRISVAPSVLCFCYLMVAVIAAGDSFFLLAFSFICSTVINKRMNPLKEGDTRARCPCSTRTIEAMEEDMLEFVGQARNVTHVWQPVELPSSISNPIVLSAMQTFNGPDTAGIRIDSLDRDGFRVKIEEERSRDPEVLHTEETVGYIVFSPGVIRDISGNVIGEAGTVRFDQPDAEVWRRIEPSVNIDDAVAFVQILSFNGSHPVHARATDVEPETGERRSSFFFKMEEWEGQNLRHTSEQIGYVVLRPGQHRLRDTVEIEVGRVSGVNHEWTRGIHLGRSGVDVVIAQSQTFNGPQAIVARLDNVGDQQFDVRLQEAEAQGRHRREIVGYIATNSRS